MDKIRKLKKDNYTLFLPIDDEVLDAFRDLIEEVSVKLMQITMGAKESSSFFMRKDFRDIVAFPTMDTAYFDVYITVDQNNIAKYPKAIIIETPIVKLSKLINGEIEYVDPPIPETVKLSDREYLVVGKGLLDMAEQAVP